MNETCALTTTLEHDLSALATVPCQDQSLVREASCVQTVTSYQVDVFLTASSSSSSLARTETRAILKNVIRAARAKPGANNTSPPPSSVSSVDVKIAAVQLYLQ